ncbi:sodium/hydrogen exchanger 2-like [Cajanus cajan]|uniref:sodium/hydrogen exchanger 2-like n=1 Tax=Cajanus cajan TaxID=3821 RepID=UPI00098D90F8|nr:sodium/hydrogen exchanger 2-like [Cajanus cajan]
MARSIDRIEELIQVGHLGQYVQRQQGHRGGYNGRGRGKGRGSGARMDQPSSSQQNAGGPVHAFATLSFVLETFIFLYVGMDALDIEKWRFVSDRPKTSVAVSSVLLGLVLAGRAAFVFPLSFLSNLTKKSPSERISFREQVIIWWAGLMRGAVSMALAYNQFTMSGHTELRTNAIMITSTITAMTMGSS